MAHVDDEFEYEEITNDEVDLVVSELEKLTAIVTSPTILAFLEECSTNVYYLVYDDEEDDLSSAA